MKNKNTFRVMMLVCIIACGISFSITPVSAGKKVSLAKKTTVTYAAKKTIPLKNNSKKVQWKVKNKKIVKIVKKSKKGVTVKGLKGGTTVITAKIGKKKYNCKVRVKYKNAVQKAESYRYKVVPLLAPFDEYFYVQTDYPDAMEIRFLDPSSRYYSKNQKGYMKPVAERYYDVKYENKKSGRVKGGYLFSAYKEHIDGGTLNLQVYNSKSNSFQTTKIKVSCPAVKSAAQYLVDTSTTSSMGFFAKMDALQKKLESISIYPRRLLDSSKKNKNTPYPFLTTSPYKELYLNTYYRMYNTSSDYLFASDLYPFVLDSLTFPGILKEAAKIIAPGCNVKQGENHYEIDVTYNGTTRTYGGDGNGNSNAIYTSDVKINYLFDRSSSDIVGKVTLTSLKKTLEIYGKAADQHIAAYESIMEGNALENKIGSGAWLRVGIEPFYSGQRPDICYTYISKDSVLGGIYYIEDAWVDGRYININNQFCLGEKFSNRPNADIIVKNQKYTTIQGYERQGDLYFMHNENDDQWYALYNYLGGDIELIQPGLKVPAEFQMTRSQVESMQIDKNRNSNPRSGFIFDGTVAPGTVFKN